MCENGYVKNVNGSTSSSIAPLSADQVVAALTSSAISDHDGEARELSVLGGALQPNKIMQRVGARSAGAKMSKFV